MSLTAPVVPVDRAHLIDWYQRNRTRSRQLFDLLDPDAYYTRPIALRNPIVFYEGHLPAFSVIALLQRGLGLPGVDAGMERLFERGIDPDTVDQAVPRSGAGTIWPSRDDVQAFGRRADEAIIAALGRATFNLAGGEHRAMRRGEAIFTALEHESMHQETLLYMWHRLPHDQKHAPLGERAPRGFRYELGGEPPQRATVTIPAGVVTLGADRAASAFGWDNEFAAHRVGVAAFEIDVHSVTNAEFLEFVGAGGYRTPEWWSDAGWQWREQDGIAHPAFWARVDGRWFWRGMFENIPLPAAWPVYVSGEEAAAFARWRGRRLPTEAEYHRAAFGTPAGSSGIRPSGASRGAKPPQTSAAETSTSRRGSPSRSVLVRSGRVPGACRTSWATDGSGRRPSLRPSPGSSRWPRTPRYSADFFDGQHYVIKGASPATARELVRRSFRNWFRPNYPFVYAKFRTAVS